MMVRTALRVKSMRIRPVRGHAGWLMAVALSVSRIASAVSLALILSACASAPKPATEAQDPVKTVAAGFRAGGHGLAFTVLYDLQEPFDNDVKAVAKFQNPAGGKPLTAERKVPAGERRIALKSPVLFEIRNHKDYTVVLTLYRDGRVVAVHRDKARFDVDGAVVPMFIKRGITVR